jgi:phosphopantothenoylcysteine decarboxylase/phosphopantothenate--cysteine ligase
MIVANDVSRSDLGMESAENEVTIFFRDQHSQRIPRGSKKNIARELVKIISNTKKNV